MRTVYRNHERFENTYFKKFPGFYVTGDGKPQKLYYIYSVGNRNHKKVHPATTKIVWHYGLSKSLNTKPIPLYFSLK